VLVVGAGVTGLTLAIELRRRGVDVRVIDRLAAFPTSSRGKGVQPRTLEVFDDLGVVEQVLAGAKTDMRARIYQGSRFIVELDLIAQPTPDVPYPNIAYLPEWRTETILHTRLAELGTRVELSHELTGLEQGDGEVTATVRQTQTGATESLCARYLVGSDGGRSTVRKLLGLRFDGETKPEHFLVGDIAILGLEPADTSFAWLHPDGVVGVGALTGTGAWQVLIELPPDSPLADEPATLELFQRLFRERTGRTDLELRDPTWLSHFRFNRRLVDRYRDGQVFVAGDAAHVHSPAGGQGMNTGVQDAYNLGWKLAAVLQGKAPKALLDSYERERLPVAGAVLRGSSQGHDAIFSDQPLMTLLRERVLLPLLSLRPVKGALARSMAQLGVNYRGLPLTLEPRDVCGLPALPGHASEVASLGDRLSFQRGPHAGDRAPDARGLSRDGFPLRLFDRLRGPQWSLLLFDGRGQTAAGYARLRAVAAEAEALLRADVRITVVVMGESAPAALMGEGLLRDPSGEIHRLYGAQAEALYLIRPDGYIGTRSQPASVEQLRAYLCGVFAPPVAHAAGE
jgi:2-polyprenyl-6-methoxyphenol hydroxylase-like FAD-dependent oxidoreductase